MPTAFAGSVSATAQLPPISRSRRRRFPGDPVVLAARAARAARPAGRVQLRRARAPECCEFFANGYWRRVRERKAILAISFLCLAVPTLLGGYWAWRDPGPASGLVPSQYQSVTQPRTPGKSLGLTVDEESAMASQIFTNNIGVTFLAFAGGLLLGLGTLYVLLQNGVLLGVVGGLGDRRRQRARRSSSSSPRTACSS